MNFLKVNILTLILMVAAGCTQTLIVYKPKAKIDPLPTVTKAVAAQTPATEKDPLRQKQWNLDKVGFNGQAFEGNYNVRIAVLSTGVDYNHEDLKGQIMINVDEISQEGIADEPGANNKDDDENGLVDDIVGYDIVDGDGLAFDRHGAGTEIAGVIGAVTNNGKGISGLIDKASLYPIRYIDDKGQSSVANLVGALRLLTKVKVDVAFVQTFTLDYGGQKRSGEVEQAELLALRSVLSEIAKKDIPLVVGAGDDMTAFGQSSIDKLLRTFDNIVFVTSTNKDDQLSFLSSFGFEDVQIAAPGEEVWTTKLDNQYGTAVGTPVAAAHVTAALAAGKAKLGTKAKTKDLITALMDDNSGDAIPALDRLTRSGNRLNIKKYLNAVAVR